MAENNPKYYWLKLKDDFFMDKRVKKLRKSEKGDTVVIIYLKMMLRTLKTGGRMVFDGLEENDYEELALDIDEDEQLCKTALNMLIKYGLIEKPGDGAYFLPEVAVSTGNESASAVRVREYREKKKALHCNGDVTQCNADVTKCNTEIEKDIERDTEKDIYTEKETEIKEDIYSENKEDYAASAAAARLPLRNGKEYYVFENEIEDWKSAYPKVDIAQELKIMRSWLEANAERQKDKDGMPRFINAWLARKQEQAFLQPEKNAYEPEEFKKPKFSYSTSPSYDIEAAQRKMDMSVPVLPPKKRKSR